MWDYCVKTGYQWEDWFINQTLVSKRNSLLICFVSTSLFIFSRGEVDKFCFVRITSIKPYSRVESYWWPNYPTHVLTKWWKVVLCINWPSISGGYRFSFVLMLPKVHTINKWYRLFEFRFPRKRSRPCWKLAEKIIWWVHVSKLYRCTF